MLLHSSRSHGNIDADTSVRTERIEKPSIQIDMETTVCKPSQQRTTGNAFEKAEALKRHVKTMTMRGGCLQRNTHF